MKKFLCFIIVAAALFAAVSNAHASLYISSGNPPDGTVGKYYRATFSAGGSTSANLSWEISGYFPGVLNSTKTGSGASISISGTPELAGPFNISVKVKNGNNESDFKSYTVLVAENSSGGGGTSGGEGNTGGELSIGGYLRAEHVGTLYPENTDGEVWGKATADGGTPPYTWSVVKGYVPKGMCLGSPNDNGSYFAYNDHTGPYTTLCGMPVLEGTYNFTLKVTDSAGQSATRDFSIVIDGGDFDDISIGGDDYDGNSFFFYNGEYFTEKTIGGGIAEGGTAPYTWSVAAGNLPTGLRLLNGDENLYEQHEITINNRSHQAYLKGVPYGAGTFKFILKVTDRDGRSAYREYTLVLDKGDRIDPNANGSETLTFDLPEIDGDFVSSGTVGQSYSGSASASGGTAPYTWSVSYGDLPEGISLAGTTGNEVQFTGKPIAQGFYNFTLKVTDSKGNSSARTFMIKVVEAPSSPTTNTPTTNTPTTDTPTTDTPTDNTPTIDTPTTDTPITDTPTTNIPTTNTPTTDTPITDTPTTNTPTEAPASGGGGGGCNSGFGVLILAALVLKRLL